MKNPVFPFASQSGLLDFQGAGIAGRKAVHVFPSLTAAGIAAMSVAHLSQGLELGLQASKNRRGGTLWRSARERKAWLKDARRGLDTQDLSCAAYVASILVDRQVKNKRQ